MFISNVEFLALAYKTVNQRCQLSLDDSFFLLILESPLQFEDKLAESSIAKLRQTRSNIKVDKPQQFY